VNEGYEYVQTILMHFTRFNNSIMEKISYFTFVTEKNNAVHPYKESPFNFAQVVAVIPQNILRILFSITKLMARIH